MVQTFDAPKKCLGTAVWKWKRKAPKSSEGSLVKGRWLETTLSIRPGELGRFQPQGLAAWHFTPMNQIS